MPAYVQEFEAALQRTERLGLDASPVRVVVRNDCVDMAKTMPVLLDYFARHDPAELTGQTLAIHFALLPLLVRETGVPFQLTIGWMVHDGRIIFQHDEEIYRRFLREKLAAWSREGMPFHLWLTSPAHEVLDVTFEMNLGWAKTREQCEKLVIYQPAHTAPGKDVYGVWGAVEQKTGLSACHRGDSFPNPALTAVPVTALVPHHRHGEPFHGKRTINQLKLVGTVVY
jgi:hypothetical protein